jgi:hypothetical protein
MKAVVGERNKFHRYPTDSRREIAGFWVVNLHDGHVRRRSAGRKMGISKRFFFAFACRKRIPDGRTAIGLGET